MGDFAYNFLVSYMIMQIQPLLLKYLPLFMSQNDTTKEVVSGMTQPIHINEHKFLTMLEGWKDGLINFGIRVLLAIVFFFIARWVINAIIRVLKGIMDRRNLTGVAVSLINSIVIALLYIAVGIAVISILGVKSVSLAAVLASMGLAVGMALSGQLQNLAGGVIIVVTKPFAIGDFIQAQNVEGTVKSVSLFHTVITTIENKVIFIPNGALSSGVIINPTAQDTRRLQWTFGIDYDSDVDKALVILRELLEADERVLKEKELYIGVSALNASSVDILVRAWVNVSDVLAVTHGFNLTVFHAFNEAGISFPFPQITVSHRKE